MLQEQKEGLSLKSFKQSKIINKYMYNIKKIVGRKTKVHHDMR